MGKRILAQRKGKGSIFKATLHAKANTSYPKLSEEEENKVMKAEIIELLNCPSRSAVLAKILVQNGKEEFIPAAEGIFEGKQIEIGKKAEIKIGNILPLSEIPEGCPIFNIELKPNDGGSLVKASGLYALVMTKEKKQVQARMPSGKTINLNPKNKATIGLVAAGGRKEKPMIKAGTAHFRAKARHKQYPVVRGVAMNPPSHPFGGYQHHPGKSKSVSRHAPPGRKVGAIASKRTGRRKKN